MAQKYIQSTLDEKLTTSDFGAALLIAAALTGYTGLYNYIEYDIWGWWLFWDLGCGLLRFILLLRFALLSKLVGLASVVCVPVSTVHRSSR
jgi:hypothetical protein